MKRVYDGDTIILEDDQRVRLLGVNTPEIESRHRQSESGGEAAKEWLQKQLQGKKVYLEFDEEKHDHYKRLLAHIFLPDGKHLNLALVENGLAIVNIIPPNIRYANILINAQQQAEKQSLGVWSISDYQAYPLHQISSGRKGWQRLIGTPLSIKSSRKYTRLIFTDKVNAISLGLFNLLEENKRMVMLQPIASQYTIIYDYLKSMNIAKVTTAVALTKEMEEKVLNKVVELTGNKTSIENKIDPSILGGFILRVGDMQYDASISSNLNTLRKQFDDSQYIPKI